MFTIALYLWFLLHFSSASTTPPYNATDYILLDCGGSESNAASGGRNWLPDTNSDYLPPNAEIISTTSKTTSTQPVPYTTARIFHSEFTYSFSQLSTGPKFIRLYFYPSTYFAFNTSDLFFSVFANNYTLLSNFSAFLAVSYTNTLMKESALTLMKEYVVNINDRKELNLTFLPSPNSFAFANGIEIVSMPDRLYRRGEDVEIKFVGQTNPFTIPNTTAFETVCRLNVGGNDVTEIEDTGMFRAWKQDDAYVPGLSKGLTQYMNVTVNYTSDTPPYTAPQIVYTTARFMNENYSLNYNMSWNIRVDSGFYYLIRLHFCEIFLEIREVGDRIFTIFINKQIAEPVADVIRWGHGPQVAVTKDYVTYVRDQDNTLSKQDILLEMNPSRYLLSAYRNALLNGMEIFKLSRLDGSLAAPNPSPVSTRSTPERSALPPQEKKSKSWPLILAVTGGVIGGLGLIISLVSFLIFRRRKRVEDSATSDTKSLRAAISYKSRSSKTGQGPGSTLPSGLCRHFSFEEIQFATGNFDANFVIGEGGFGTVYRGIMDNGSTTVAVKRLKATSKQGENEFHTEIEMLSKLRHRHLVSLIGYCNDADEMILVYDYMSRGTLRDHLYNTENPPLPWKQRLQICIGAAKGLNYLHSSAKHTIIHRDVKSTNILVDEKWVAKVSDFGLSKIGPSSGTETHISTMVKGSFGYLDPEYVKRQQLTVKSDVYSFGVVLLEVLSARPALNPNLHKEQVNLVLWARKCSRNGTLHQILDRYLHNEIATECLDKYVEIAFHCLMDTGIERPEMNDVVWSLELALELQEAAEKRGSIGQNASPSFRLLSEATTTEDDVFSRSGEVSSSRSKSSGILSVSSASDGFKSENVFSEILNPAGR